MTFAALKKNRQNDLDRLTSELSKLTTSKQTQEDDDRFWYPAVDKAGNGNAIIRFLPAPEGEDVPFVRLFNHSFQGPTGSWYIENCLTTKSKDDPVCDYNRELWNTGSEQAQNQARTQKRKLTFIANILVLKDTANPENEGKVKLFKFGKKIFDKLNELMNPSFEDEKPVNPFDLWEGANFKLRIRTVDKFRNYDKSEFDKPGVLFEDDKKLEAVYKQEFPLQPFLADSEFKSYDELKAKLDRVLGLNKSPTKPTGKVETLKKAEPKGKQESSSDEVELDDEFFKGLAEESDEIPF